MAALQFIILASLFGLIWSQTANVWLSTGDSLIKLQQQASIPSSGSPVGGYTINVNRNQRHQPMDGFGAAISNAAGRLLWQNLNDRAGVLRELFSTQSGGIGLNYIRLVMGGSDFNAVPPYTYNDIAGGEDFGLTQFTIEKDREFIIPLLREIRAINPNVKIMGSPWSAPAWMKTSNSLNGGSLESGDQYLDTLAEYFVAFIRAYEAEGIPIEALTLQNEPEHEINSYPTMYMSWETQADLIKRFLGPKFRAAGISTKIIIWDHNWDMSWYPMNILNDQDARQYIAGSAWHCYGGNRFDPAAVKNAHPDKDLYFTECTGGDWDTHFGSTLGWNTQQLFIGQTRIGSKNVLMWNMALDDNHGPRVGVDGGCADCRGVITVHGDGSITRNVEYYSLGHFSKFVQNGAFYVMSTSYEGSEELESTAFVNPDGSIVIVVLNASWGDVTKTFQIELDGRYYYYQNLPSRSVVTFII